MLVGAVVYNWRHMSSPHPISERVAAVAPVGCDVLDASGQSSPHPFQECWSLGDVSDVGRCGREGYGQLCTCVYSQMQIVP